MEVGGKPIAGEKRGTARGNDIPGMCVAARVLKPSEGRDRAEFGGIDVEEQVEHK